MPLSPLWARGFNHKKGDEKMLLLKLIYWKSIDLGREIKRIWLKLPRKVHLYGIYGFFGLPGKGKTMALAWQLQEYRKLYGDRILIMTNFNYKDQDLEFKHWKDLLKEYNKPLVVAWDEVQNEFNSRDFKNFPVTLLTLLTQNRKGNGKQILYTAQRWDRVDKIFRELTHYAIDCNTIFGRWTRLRYYFWEDYQSKQSTPQAELRRLVKPVKTIGFVQTDDLRDSYDSYKMLESAKSKEYLDRADVINLL